MSVFRLLLLVVLFFATNASTSSFAETLMQYRLINPEKSTLDLVAEQFEIIGRQGTAFDVLVPVERANDFFLLAPTAALLSSDVNLAIREQWQKHGFVPGYRTHEEIVAYAKDLEIRYPDLVRVENYGTTEHGLPLFYIKISQRINENSTKPKVIIDAGTHGDEIIGVEVLLRQIDELLQQYGKNTALTKLIDSLQIYAVPVVNPEGYTRNVSRNLRQFSHLFNITNFPLVPPIRGADTAPR